MQAKFQTLTSVVLDLVPPTSHAQVLVLMVTFIVVAARVAIVDQRTM